MALNRPIVTFLPESERDRAARRRLLQTRCAKIWKERPAPPGQFVPRAEWDAWRKRLAEARKELLAHGQRIERLKAAGRLPKSPRKWRIEFLLPAKETPWEIQKRLREKRVRRLFRKALKWLTPKADDRRRGPKPNRRGAKKRDAIAYLLRKTLGL